MPQASASRVQHAVHFIETYAQVAQVVHEELGEKKARVKDIYGEEIYNLTCWNIYSYPILCFLFPKLNWTR